MSALLPWISICIHLAPFFLSPALEPYVSVIIVVVYPVPRRQRWSEETKGLSNTVTAQRQGDPSLADGIREMISRRIRSSTGNNITLRILWSCSIIVLS